MIKAPKTPQNKKELSLQRDTRNSYGSNAKASRKIIPRAKQGSHQAERRAVRSPLRKALGTIDVDLLHGQEAHAVSAGKLKKLAAFRKQSDISLGTSLKRKLAGPEENSRKNYGRRPV